MPVNKKTHKLPTPSSTTKSMKHMSPWGLVTGQAERGEGAVSEGLRVTGQVISRVCHLRKVLQDRGCEP